MVTSQKGEKAFSDSIWAKKLEDVSKRSKKRRV